MPMAWNNATIIGAPASFNEPAKRNIAAVAIWTVQSAIVPAREWDRGVASTGHGAVRTDGVVMTVSFCSTDGLCIHELLGKKTHWLCCWTLVIKAAS